MDRPDIDAIEARLRAATPGPWRVVLARTLLHITSALREVVALSVSPPRVPEREIREEYVRRTRADADLIAHAPTDLAALLAYARALEAEIHWHEDRNGTRSEQEQQDAEWAADDEKIDAMSDDEIRASLEASGVRVDEAIRRSDALIRVCTERVALAVEVDRLTAERDRLTLTLRCERGEWAPTGWAYNFPLGQWRRETAPVAKVWRNEWMRRPDGNGCVAWGWEVCLDSMPVDGYAPTALEAIEAADAALREVPHG